jgi:hypothetical protein
MTATIYELWIAMISLALAIGCYSISQLVQHGKFKWMSKNPFGFWGDTSDRRKYKRVPIEGQEYSYRITGAPVNFYYKYIARVKYKERWFTSTWLTVNLTDGYHMCQSLSFLLISLTVVLLTGFPYLLVWPGIVFLHAAVYNLLSKKV